MDDEAILLDRMDENPIANKEIHEKEKVVVASEKNMVGKDKPSAVNREV